MLASGDAANQPADDQSAGAQTGASGDADAGAADPKGPSPQEIIKKIDEETQQSIQKLLDDANRRKALALKKAIPLPQRKTTAFDFLEVERDRMRTALNEPLLADADIDAHIKSVLDNWHSQRPAAAN